MDATTLGQRFTVLAMSVLYRGCAIPVAWKIVKATEKGAWKPYWIELFTYLQDSVPTWIECSFKDTKRGGFGWHQTKTTDPVRAERQWLAIATAMLWLISVGAEDEVAHCHQNQSEYSAEETVSTSCSTSAPRRLSCLRRGFLSILVALLWGQTLPLGHFYSFPWTDSFSFSSA